MDSFDSIMDSFYSGQNEGCEISFDGSSLFDDSIVDVATLSDEQLHHMIVFESNPEAMTELGRRLIERSDSVEARRKGFSYLINATNKRNYWPAASLLGELFSEGRLHTKVNLNEALKWFLKARELGDYTAEVNLYDVCTKLDLKEAAHYWHYRASLKGDLLAKIYYAIGVYNGLEIAPSDTSGKYTIISGITDLMKETSGPNVVDDVLLTKTALDILKEVQEADPDGPYGDAARKVAKDLKRNTAATSALNLLSQIIG